MRHLRNASLRAYQTIKSTPPKTHPLTRGHGGELNATLAQCIPRRLQHYKIIKATPRKTHRLTRCEWQISPNTKHCDAHATQAFRISGFSGAPLPSPPEIRSIMMAMASNWTSGSAGLYRTFIVGFGGPSRRTCQERQNRRFLPSSTVQRCSLL